MGEAAGLSRGQWEEPGGKAGEEWKDTGASGRRDSEGRGGALNICLLESSWEWSLCSGTPLQTRPPAGPRPALLLSCCSNRNWVGPIRSADISAPGIHSGRSSRQPLPGTLPLLPCAVAAAWEPWWRGQGFLGAEKWHL